MNEHANSLQLAKVNDASVEWPGDEVRLGIIGRVSVMWAWQRCKDIILTNYQDLMFCKTERVTVHKLHTACSWLVAYPV